MTQSESRVRRMVGKRERTQNRMTEKEEERKNEEKKRKEKDHYLPKTIFTIEKGQLKIMIYL